MLRRPPTTLQLTQDDLTAYEISREQRLVTATKARLAKQQAAAQQIQYLENAQRHRQAQQQPDQQQMTKPSNAYPAPPQAMQTEDGEGDTEPDLSEDDDDLDAELDDSHLARRPAAPSRPRARDEQPHLRAPPPRFHMPGMARPPGQAQSGADADVDGDEEMHDLDMDTPSAPSQAAAAARKERRVKPAGRDLVGQAPTGLDGMDGAGDGREEMGRVRAPVETREERERRARARIMGTDSGIERGTGRSGAPERGTGARAPERR